ncbi:dTDP-glucose 4,6-dehydratase [Bradyrhizobium sp. HKCCYLS20291]|uniref:dTDP-glucose 4,6-dehydratase n=1 Tax=Bradyrhizobium sp. HKCCYLS20291 TaxID=3420766 RepID=UPI003EBDDC81
MAAPATARLDGRTILVTGGSGFIGSALIRHLLRDTGARIVNVDKLTYAASPAALATVEGNRAYAFHRHCICDADALRAIFAAHQPDAVMHLAAESHVDRSIDGPGDFIQTNIVGTFTLLQEALRHYRSLPRERARHFRFLHVSTDEVFGSLGADGLFSETTAYQPNSPYSASKASSDHLVRAWRETYGLPTVVTNCSNNYGPYQFPEKLIPHMIIKGLEGATLPVYGDGGNIRDWLHVEDHARALGLVLEHGTEGATYTIGGRSERTNLAVVEAICDALDALVPMAGGHQRRALIRFVTDRPGHDRRYAIDPTTIERELGWSPRADFETALRHTVRWYAEHEAWWRGILAGGYAAERLGRNEPRIAAAAQRASA